MEAHTPKREAIEKFIGHEKAAAKHWIVRTVDEAEDPIVRLRATRSDQSGGGPEKILEVHTRQVRLDSNELDESTKTMIRRWLASL